MERMTFEQVKEKFRQYNKAYDLHYGVSTEVRPMVAIVVYSQSNWNKPFTEKERSYRITSNGGKALFNNMLGNSIFGDCLDGEDLGVRLDAYDWKVDYCYIESFGELSGRDGKGA